VPLGVRVLFLPEVALVTIQPPDFRDLRELQSPQFLYSHARCGTLARSTSCVCACGVAAEKALLLARKVRQPLRAGTEKGRRPEGRRLRVSGSGDDPPMLAGEVGVGRDRARRCEVEIALKR